MDQSQTLPIRGHVRNKSSTGRPTRPRSSTKGPLDVDDPAILPPKDFSYLLRPEIYHPLTPVTIPPPFRNSSKQPPPDSPIDELLSRGHFRAAAIAAVQALTGTAGQPAPAPTDYARIFELLYVRLSCLTLIDATQIAAQEVRALEDVNSAIYMDEISGTHLVPWDLRVLIVRLQAMGFGDPRRAIMSYYDLTREARAEIATALNNHDNSASEVWKDRLVDLGMKVAGAMVEMDDLAGAAHHLTGLKSRPDGKLNMAKALLWLHLGNTDAARLCVKEGESGDRTVSALCGMADGEYETALSTWKELRDEMGDDEMIAVNLAVCLLYTGRMEEGREILESLVDSGFSSHTLLFNLATIFELCTDRSRSLKTKLVERVAAMDPSTSGWERANGDFKL
ncbi:Obg-like ATPase [Diaporthe eres]|uniref:Obg-like ATPase n=1 Tax=Diaporthe eres TaxID=83184 RepID=A0ABR1PDV9_DIAER